MIKMATEQAITQAAIKAKEAAIAAVRESEGFTEPRTAVYAAQRSSRP